jgi:hypothetical protein
VYRDSGQITDLNGGHKRYCRQDDRPEAVGAGSSDYYCKYHGKQNGGHKDQNLVSQTEHNAYHDADNR